MSGTPWTPEREALIRSLYGTNTSLAEKAAILGISAKAISAKAMRMGIAVRYNPWPQEKDDKLREFFMRGDSYVQIAKALQVSKASIAGRTFRLGLKREIRLPPPREKKPRTRRPRVARLVNHGNRFDHMIVEAGDPLPSTPETDRAIPIEQRKSLVELTSDTCRWPVGDPGTDDFFFCGAKPLDGCPYCAAHSRRAFSRFGVAA